MIRLIIRVVFTVAVLLLMLLPFYITFCIKAYRINSVFVRLAFRVGVAIWGIRVTTQGRISRKSNLLIISNHFSYLDIFALGSVMNVRFTPKSEIALWPVIGFFCKVTGCVFIDRRLHKTMYNKNVLHNAINAGTAISLFPEGTTSDGTGLLPFKSSFFSIAENYDVTVQPVSIVYEKLNGKAVTYENRHMIGWYGDMDFFPHLMVFLQQRSVDITLVFHDAVNCSSFTSRKELARYCESVIRPFARIKL